MLVNVMVVSADRSAVIVGVEVDQCDGGVRPIGGGGNQLGVGADGVGQCDSESAMCCS